MQKTNEDLEWNIPDATVPLSQGDLLLSRDPATRDIYSISVVITADCDITHRKYGTQLASLRIISLQEYLRHYWAQRKLRRLIEAEANKVHELINSWHFKKRAEANPISLETVFSWIRDCSSDVICRDLAIPAEQAKKMSECLNRFRAILEALDKSATADPFSTLVAARTVATGKTDAACRDDAIKQAKNEPLPDDVFLLPSLPQLDIGPTVVLLRDIVAIPVAMVRYTTADARTGDHFLRIGTLQPTFKYAMSQAFGNLYARIGLPEEYEKRCKLVMDDLHRLNFKV